MADVRPRKPRARHAPKLGGPRRRVPREIHLGIDEGALEIRAVEVTASHIGDAPILPDLLGRIPAREQTAGVTAEAASRRRRPA